jgi:hypothetical protein
MPSHKETISRVTRIVEKYSGLFALLGFMTLYMIIRISLANRTSLTSMVIDLVAAYFIVFGIWYIRKHDRFTKSVLRYDFLAKKFPAYTHFFPYLMLFFGLLLHVHKLTLVVLCTSIVLYTERLVSLVGFHKHGLLQRIKKAVSRQYPHKVILAECLYATLVPLSALLLLTLR